MGWGDNRTGQATVPSGLSDVVAIASGEWHNIALKTDGTVVAWGYNAGVPHDLGSVVAIGAGGYHNMAIKADGTVRAWGANEYGQANVPAGLNNVVAVRGGWVHSLALKADGTVVAWGRNLEGQANVPAGLNNVVAISAGEYHNLALKADGTVVGWGWNGLGQATLPHTVANNNIVAIAAGGLHSLALKSDGTVVAWGWNEHGQSTVPAGLTDVVAIAGGAEHSLALKSDGTVVGWGANDAWASNDPDCAFIGSSCPRVYAGQIDVPAGLNNVVAISAGVFHSLALKAENGVQAPSAPALSVQAVGDTSVRLTWIDLADETGYRLEARVGASGNWEEIATPGANATAYQHTGLTAGTTMYYRLRAFNAGGTSPYSAEVTATTSAPPPLVPMAPTLAATVLSHTAVDLAWNDVDHESGYSIERRTSSGEWVEIATPAANETSFSDAGLAPATTYLYRIRALSTAGNSPYSAEAHVRTQNAPLLPPSTPTLSTSGISHSTIVLEWSDVANETGYKLEVKNSAGAWTELATLNAGIATFSHNELNASTTYTYRISAFNGAGSSALSSDLTVTTQAPPLLPPGTPTLSTSGISHSTIVLEWSDVANETGYKLEVKNSAGAWTELATLNAGIATFSHNELNASTTYTYRISAFNAAGSSAYSEELSLTTAALPLQPPVAPMLQGQAWSHAQVALSWSAVENETGFSLQRRDGTGGSWVTISSPAAEVVNYIDTQVSPSTTYAYRIAATNAAGSSGYSDEVNVTTPAAPVLPPAAPSLQATAISPTEVRLEWSDVADEVNYILERQLDGVTASVTTLPANVASFTESDLAPETTYIYRIRAANGGGESAWTEATVTTPAKPLEVQASVNFVRVDDQASGLWPLEFGIDGTWIASQSPDLPSGVGVTVLPETPVVWAADSSETRALIGTGGANRVAAGWSGAPLTLNLSIPRGTPRRIALYFVDWHRTGASQQVSIRDAATGTNLDTRSFEAFGEGKYLVYDIDGNVEVTLNSSEGDALLSGIFVGGGLPAPISDNPLAFNVLRADPNGMRVRISGDSGQRFKVQRTTDFRNWTDVANSILVSPSADMTLSGESTGALFRTVNTQ